MTKFEISDSEYDYYQWRAQAQQSGLHEKIALAYYTPYTDDMYTFYLNENHRITPVFTKKEWLRRMDLSKIINSFNSEKFSNYDSEIIMDLAKTSAARQKKHSGEIEDVLWNGLTFGVTGIFDEIPAIDIQLTDYYTCRSDSGKLMREVFDAAYNAGIDPDASYSEIASQIPELNLPYRDEHYREPKHAYSFSDQPRLCGHTTVVILSCSNKNYIPVEKRNGVVSEAPNWWSPIPNGSFQPSSHHETPDLYKNTLRGFSQELLPNVDNVREYLDEKVTEGKMHVDFLGAGIGAINAYLHTYSLVYVEDSELSESIMERSRKSWRSEQLEFFEIADNNQMKSLLDSSQTTPYNVLGVAEAFVHLEEEYDMDLPFTIERANLK